MFVFFSLLTLLLPNYGWSTNPEGQAYLDQNFKKDNVITLPSGLQYEILQHGALNRATPTSTSDSCTCHYEGKLIDGTVFDSSIQRGTPATFSPSGVIGGWTEALMLMRPGDKWILTLPSHLGYGDRGSGSKIPGGAVLIFELELLDVQESSWTDWLTMRTGFMFVYLLVFLLYNFCWSGTSSKDVAVIKKFGQEFLVQNQSKAGVVTLKSGLQYKVLRAGEGSGHPLPGSPCSCHYEGRCAQDWPNGKKFDSSYDRG